jgi:hypothetical protein
MSPIDAFGELLNFSVTEEYRRGLYVEISGMVINIALLVVLVPFLVWLTSLRKRRRVLKMAGFFTLQFIREAVDLLLRAGGAADFPNLLREELLAGRMESLFTHQLYGNTADLFELLRTRMKSGVHVQGHIALHQGEIETLRARSQSLLDKLDQQILLFSSVGLQSYTEKFFEARMLLFPLRDYFTDLKAPAQQNMFLTDDIRGLSTACATYFDQWFTSEKRKPDRATKRDWNRSIVCLLVKLPFLLSFRLVAPTYHRWKKTPYIDPSASNFFAEILRWALNQPGVAPLEVANSLALPLQKLIDYSFGYTRPDDAEQRRILVAVSVLAPERVWSQKVIDLLLSDLYDRTMSPMEYESAKSEAAMWWTTLVGSATQKQPKTTAMLLKLVLSVRAQRPDRAE